VGARSVLTAGFLAERFPQRENANIARLGRRAERQPHRWLPRDASRCACEVQREMNPLAKPKEELEHAFTTKPERRSAEDERKRYIWALTKISIFLKQVLKAKVSQIRIYELAIALGGSG